MSKLPEQILDSPTVRAIYAAYESHSEKLRPYLGASGIGRPCDRALWYEFRWCGGEKFSGRMLRLFQTGHLEEKRMVDDLRAIGCEVHAVDAVGQQYEVVALGGHFRGHMDGVVLGVPDAPKTWHLLECKTHNAKSFKQLAEKGVAVSNPEHWCQMQVYIHLAQGGLERSLYLAVNKDTDELYAERVNYCRAEAEQILERARSIIEAAEPPEKIGGPDHWQCKFCSHHARCHGVEGGHSCLPAVPCKITCRNCIHSTPIMDDSTAGQWRCERHNKPLAYAEQEAGCEDHRLIPSLVTFAVPIDSHDQENWIEYANKKDGLVWRNAAGDDNWSSEELSFVPVSAIGEVANVKKQLGATVVSEAEAPF